MQERIVLLGAEVPSGRSVAKKLRGEQYACTLMTSGAKAQEVAQLGVRGIVIAGEEAEGALPPDPALLGLGIPVLALGSCARSLLEGLGTSRDWVLHDAVLPVYYKESRLFAQMQSGERWVQEATFFDVPAPYSVVADGDGMPVAFANEEAGIYLLQFQIERNDPDGMAILRSFAENICGCTAWWTQEAIVAAATQRVVDAARGKQAVCAISGGLDSSVAALLAKQALGDEIRCVFVDTGLLREGEAEASERFFTQEMGVHFQRVDASAAVMQSLKGLRHMDAKWSAVENEITNALCNAAGMGQSLVFIKGTNYVDLHNGDAPKAQNNGSMNAVEPLGDLFKEEIRSLGLFLGLPEHLLNRQPFPGMGLAARIRGEITAQRLQVLRRADAIFVDEMEQAGQARRVDRYFAMMEQTGDYCVVILRALQGAEPNMTVARLPFDLMERATERIQAEQPVVDRVLYDMTPGMAEWPL